MMSGDDNGHRQQPHDMRSLLAFCADVQSEDNSEGAAGYESMDDDSREFLDEALTGLQTDVVKRMKALLKLIGTENILPNGGNPMKQENALEELEEYADDIDNANDIERIGGLMVLVRCLSSPHVGIRTKSASVLGVVVQNNCNCQLAALDMDMMPYLLDILKDDKDEDAKVKAMYSLSCLLRSNDRAKREFLEMDGFKYILPSIHAGIERLTIKSFFLMSCINLVGENNAVLLKKEFPDVFAAFLNNPNTSNAVREHCTAALFANSSNYQPFLKECLRSDLNLVMGLQERLELITDLDEFQDEARCITEFLKLVPENMEDGEVR